MHAAIIIVFTIDNIMNHFLLFFVSREEASAVVASAQKKTNKIDNFPCFHLAIVSTISQGEGGGGYVSMSRLFKICIFHIDSFYRVIKSK